MRTTTGGPFGPPMIKSPNQKSPRLPAYAADRNVVVVAGAEADNAIVAIEYPRDGIKRRHRGREPTACHIGENLANPMLFSPGIRCACVTEIW